MQGNKVMCDKGDAESIILVKHTHTHTQREKERRVNWRRSRGLLSSVAVCGA